jgi:hypothetical protein
MSDEDYNKSFMENLTNLGEYFLKEMFSFVGYEKVISELLMTMIEK